MKMKKVLENQGLFLAEKERFEATQKALLSDVLQFLTPFVRPRSIKKGVKFCKFFLSKIGVDIHSGRNLFVP